MDWDISEALHRPSQLQYVPIVSPQFGVSKLLCGFVPQCNAGLSTPCGGCFTAHGNGV